jgi:DNA-binding LytR/AlgR family response regulator
MSFVTIKTIKNEIVYLDVDCIETIESENNSSAIYTRSGRRIVTADTLQSLLVTIKKSLSKPKTVRTHTEWAG